MDKTEIYKKACYQFGTGNITNRLALSHKVDFLESMVDLTQAETLELAQFKKMIISFFDSTQDNWRCIGCKHSTPLLDCGLDDKCGLHCANWNKDQGVTHE